jgi:hypothetical protein
MIENAKVWIDFRSLAKWQDVYKVTISFFKQNLNLIYIFPGYNLKNKLEKLFLFKISRKISANFLFWFQGPSPFFPAVKRAPDGSFITLGPKRRQLPATAFISRRYPLIIIQTEIKAEPNSIHQTKIQHQQERRNKQKIFKVFL